MLNSVATRSFRHYTDLTMARPRLKKDKVKACFVRIRVTEAERAKVRLRAKKSGAKNETDWVRQRLLGDE